MKRYLPFAALAIAARVCNIVWHWRKFESRPRAEFGVYFAEIPARV